MKSSKTIIIASIIIFAGIVFYSLSNRYYIDTSTRLVVDKLTGKVSLPIVQTPEPTPTTTPKKEWSAEDFKTIEDEDIVEVNKGDFSKVVISGESTSVDEFNIAYKVTCTVTNNDSIAHTLTVKAIFYDKNNTPILTEESNTIRVESNDIESVVISTMQSVQNISSYELKLIQSNNILK